MSAGLTAVEASAPPRAAERSLSLVAAVWLSVAVTLALGALAFWPARAWVPPQRPMLKGPMVFDEFVNAPSPPLSGSGATDSAGR